MISNTTITISMIILDVTLTPTLTLPITPIEQLSLFMGSGAGTADPRTHGDVPQKSTFFGHTGLKRSISKNSAIAIIVVLVIRVRIVRIVITVIMSRILMI